MSWKKIHSMGEVHCIYNLIDTCTVHVQLYTCFLELQITINIYYTITLIGKRTINRDAVKGCNL